MRRFTLLLVAFAISMAAQEQPIILRAGTLIDGTGHISRNVSIVVEGGKITKVLAANEVKGGQPGSVEVFDTKLYDLSRYTVLPGWIDTHVHIAWHFGPDGR